MTVPVPGPDSEQVEKAKQCREFVAGTAFGVPVEALDDYVRAILTASGYPVLVADLERENEQLQAARGEAEMKLAQLRDHTLESNTAFRTLHNNAVAYLDAVDALGDARGGAPLSTTIGWLIRNGHLVPAEEEASYVLRVADLERQVDDTTRISCEQMARADRAEACVADLERQLAEVQAKIAAVEALADRWAAATELGSGRPSIFMRALATELLAALSVEAAPVTGCDTCDGSGVVYMEAQIATPGSGGWITCPDCGPTPSEAAEAPDTEEQK